MQNVSITFLVRSGCVGRGGKGRTWIWERYGRDEKGMPKVHARGVARMAAAHRAKARRLRRASSGWATGAHERRERVTQTEIATERNVVVVVRFANTAGTSARSRRGNGLVVWRVDKTIVEIFAHPHNNPKNRGPRPGVERLRFIRIH